MAGQQLPSPLPTRSQGIAVYPATETLSGLGNQAAAEGAVARRQLAADLHPLDGFNRLSSDHGKFRRLVEADTSRTDTAGEMGN